MDLDVLGNEADIALAATVLGLLLGIAPLAFITRSFLSRAARDARTGLLLIGVGALVLAIHETIELGVDVSGWRLPAIGRVLAPMLAGALISVGIVALARARPPDPEAT